MPERQNQERSVSGDEDSDVEYYADTNPQGKPGRKKNPNSQAARRDQNRIAQREFRLRKQQRIRDLEARVELLSGGKDEAMGEMRSILKDLMAENQTLRSLLKSMSSFIGDGAGGLLPKLGWDMADFNSFVNRSETDTAWESFQRHKKPTGSSSDKADKRPAEDDPSSTRVKRRKPAQDNDKDGGPDYSLLVPLNASVPTNNMYPPSARGTPNDSGLFSELMRGSGGSPMFMPSPPTAVSAAFGETTTSNVTNYQSPYMPQSIDASQPPLPFTSHSNSQASTQPRISGALNQEYEDDDDDPNRNEAYKLISYHLDNYKRNSAYCLPSSLRPSQVQKTLPHESAIDRILHPELRDRMILLREHYDLVDCLMDYRDAVTIHGDDVLAHSNWEIDEKWLRRYGLLIDPATLNICNRWRRERGQQELRMSELTPQDNTPGST